MQVLAVFPAQRLQGSCKCCHVGLIDLIAWTVIHEHADTAHLPDLLGTRGEWPRDDSGAEQRGKLSPSHECGHPVPRSINGLNTTGLGAGSVPCIIEKTGAHVRFGSKADSWPEQRRGSFTPESGHEGGALARQLRAISRRPVRLSQLFESDQFGTDVGAGQAYTFEQFRLVADSANEKWLRSGIAGIAQPSTNSNVTRVKSRVAD
jgi:hypothetical protein